MKQRRADLTLDTWNGVLAVLEDLYARRSGVAGSTDVRVVGVTNVDEAEAQLQKKSLPLTLPYIAVSPQGTEPNAQSYNAHMMRRLGVKSHLSADGTTWSILKLTPVVLTFQVMLVTDDVEQMLRMMDRWNANEKWSFMLQNDRDDDDYRIKIQVVADKSLQIPPRTMNTGGSEQFRMLSTLRASTYAGYVWQVPSIKVVELDINVTSGDIGALEDEGFESYSLVRRFVDGQHAES